MTQAVCFACGEVKVGAFNHCGQCERVPESDEDFVLSLALTDLYFKEDSLREMGKLIKKGERLHLEEDTRALLLEALSRARAAYAEDTADEDTEEMDKETFGEELVDLAHRVAREEISFALRPGVDRSAHQKESTPAHAETFGQELVDVVARITKQEWTQNEAELQEGGALSLVTDIDCEIFGSEIIHIFRCAARDEIAVLTNPPPLKEETNVASAEQPKPAGLGLSGPKISKAVPVATFLVGPYEAALFSDIEAPGMIQYEHILVIYDNERSPRLCVCAEWSRLQPTAEQRLYFLGLFEDGTHVNLGHDEDIVDRNVFALRAIEAARQRLSLSTPSALSEGEAIAITEILKDLQTKGGASEACRARYGRVLKKYDAAIVEFLKTLRDPGQAITARTTPHPDRANIDLAPRHRSMPGAKAASAQNHVTPRSLMLDIGMVMPDTPSEDFDYLKEWERAMRAQAKEIGAIEDRVKRADADRDVGHSWSKTLRRFFG